MIIRCKTCRNKKTLRWIRKKTEKAHRCFNVINSHYFACHSSITILMYAAGNNYKTSGIAVVHDLTISTLLLQSSSDKIFSSCIIKIL